MIETIISLAILINGTTTPINLDCSKTACVKVQTPATTTISVPLNVPLPDRIVFVDRWATTTLHHWATTTPKIIYKDKVVYKCDWKHATSTPSVGELIQVRTQLNIIKAWMSAVDKMVNKLNAFLEKYPQ